MKRVLFALAWVGIIGTLGLLLLGGWLELFDGNPPATVTLPFRTDKTVYHLGEEIVLHVHTCKARQYPVTVYPTLVLLPAGVTSPTVQGVEFALAPVASVGTSTGCGDFTVKGYFHVRTDVPFGRYYLKGTSVYKVNFLTDRSLDWYTNEFQVTP